MTSEGSLELACRAVGEAATLAELRRVIDAWAPRFHADLGKDLRRGPRPELRMDVTRIPGWGGFTARRGDSFFVGVGEGGRREARFTLAHELAHVVLNSAERGRFELESHEEEALCNRFAQRALAPPALIRAHFAGHGVPRSLADIDLFASRFRISLRFSLAAIDEFLPAEWPVCFVAGSWRAHPRGDGVFGVRVDGAASDDRLFVPRNCRLSTLGYSTLEAWVIDAEVGDRRGGSDPEARLKSARRGVSIWTGDSHWVARRHLAPATSAEDDRPGVLCMLDVSQLAPTLSRPRRKRAGDVNRRRRVERIPGQLDLAPAALSAGGARG